MVAQIIIQKYSFWDGFFVTIPMCNTPLFLKIHLESVSITMFPSLCYILKYCNCNWKKSFILQLYLISATFACGHKYYVTTSCCCPFSITEYVKLHSPTLFLSANVQGHSDLLSAHYSAYSASFPSFSCFPKHLKMPRSVYWYQNTWRNFINPVSFESLCPSVSILVCSSLYVFDSYYKRL